MRADRGWRRRPRAAGCLRLYWVSFGRKTQIDHQKSALVAKFVHGLQRTVDVFEGNGMQESYIFSGDTFECDRSPSSQILSTTASFIVASHRPAATELREIWIYKSPSVRW